MDVVDMTAGTVLLSTGIPLDKCSSRSCGGKGVGMQPAPFSMELPALKLINMLVYLQI